jgi:hypothetical protein
MDTAELNIRLFMAVKVILDAAVVAVGLDIPGKGGMLAFPYKRLDAFIDLYNFRLEELREKRKPWESGETQLEKVVKMLTPIDPEKLKPKANFLNQLKNGILRDAHGEEWLRRKVWSLEYDDGFSFRELMGKN